LIPERRGDFRDPGPVPIRYLGADEAIRAPAKNTTLCR
jgi:hypothetical protein